MSGVTVVRVFETYVLLQRTTASLLLQDSYRLVDLVAALLEAHYMYVYKLQLLNSGSCDILF